MDLCLGITYVKASVAVATPTRRVRRRQEICWRTRVLRQHLGSPATVVLVCFMPTITYRKFSDHDPSQVPDGAGGSPSETPAPAMMVVGHLESGRCALAGARDGAEYVSAACGTPGCGAGAACHEPW